MNDEDAIKNVGNGAGECHFPALPVKTCLSGRIAPRDTMFISVGEHEWPMPDPALDSARRK